MAYRGEYGESFRLDATGKCSLYTYTFCMELFYHSILHIRAFSALHTVIIPIGCKYPGCTRPRYRESYGYVHDFCGKTHATAYSRLMSDKKLSSYQNGCK